jgi:hypothetical protein
MLIMSPSGWSGQHGRTSAERKVGKVPVTGVGGWPARSCKEVTMGKTGRKRRARKKKGANHGKRPNA